MWLTGAAMDPEWVEGVWLPHVGRPIGAWIGWLTGWVPWSIAEILVAVVSLFLIFRILSSLSDVAAGRRRWSNALVSGMLHTASAGMLFWVWFQVAWGTAYARAPLSERMGLEVVDRVAADAAAARGLRTRYAGVIDRVNATYREIHGAAEADTVTTWREGVDLDARLERAYAALGAWLDEGSELAAPRPPAKWLLVPETFSWLGLGGIYVPYTAEAVVNGGPPGWSVVMTMAHEKAHQRFIAQEDEATFIGVLAGLSSADALLRYGAWMTVRAQLARTLAQIDPDGAAAEAQRLLPGVRRDLDAQRAYWARFEGPTEQWARAVNDTYLRSQGVADGVVAYSRAGRLIDAWLQTPRGREALAGRTARR